MMKRRKPLRYYLLAVFFIGWASLVWAQGYTVRFVLEASPAVSAPYMGIRGNIAPLSWDKTLFLVNQEIEIDFQGASATLEYKYVVDDGSDVKWEGIQNRQLQWDTGERNIRDTWNKETPVDIMSIAPIPSRDLLDDLKILEEMVLRVHPGTYRYRSEEEIRQVLSELHREFKDSMSLGAAYLALSKVTAALQCDHTKVGFNNQNRYVNTVIHEQSDKLPFTFKWFGNRMIVDRNATREAGLNKGTEILAINKVPVSEIRTALLPYVAADGATDKNRVRKLEVEGFDFRYNAFDVLYPLKYPTEDNRYSLSIRSYGEERQIVVDGMHRETRAERLREVYEDFPYTRDDTWKFEVNDGVGILTLNSFGLMGWKAMTIDYRQFLKDAFSRLRSEGIEHLIIDIRKNTGGNDEIKKELFAYLPFDREAVKPTLREGRTRFIHFPESLKPYVKTWGDTPWFYELKPDGRDGRYYLFHEKDENRKPSPKKENAFQANVYLLVGSANTSLAYYTARDFQHYGIGTLIGEETGGNLRDINGGQILFLTLPHSGIEIDFPVMGAFSKETKPNSGVVPDIRVETTLDDFRNGTDPVMEKAYELIRHHDAGN